jgi:hypothetical protein
MATSPAAGRGTLRLQKQNLARFARARLALAASACSS